MNITLDSIVPFVRYIHYIELVPAFTTHLQIAYDHRIFFCINGNYEITVENIRYRLSENSLLFVPGGVAYRLHQPESNVLLLGINFDFLWSHSDRTVPIVPAASREAFNSDGVIEEYGFTDAVIFNSVFMLEKTAHLFPYISRMLDEYNTKRLFYAQSNSAMLKQMLVMLARAYSTGYAPQPESTADEVINYIQKNCKRHLTNGDIGRELNFHPNYLNRLMLLHTGKSLHKYLLGVRLTKALDLLQSTDMKVTDIALETGFSDVQQFSKFFKSQTGMNPTDFR